MFGQADHTDRVDGVTLKSRIQRDHAGPGLQQVVGDGVQQGLRDLHVPRLWFVAQGDHISPIGGGRFLYVHEM